MSAARDHNIYAYVGNNPVTSVDPTGLAVASFLVCSAVNLGAQGLYSAYQSFARPLKATEGTRAELQKLNQQISECKDDQEREVLEMMRADLIGELSGNLAGSVEPGDTAFGSIGGAMIGEGICAFTLLPILP